MVLLEWDARVSLELTARAPIGMVARAPMAKLGAWQNWMLGIHWNWMLRVPVELLTRLRRFKGSPLVGNESFLLALVDDFLNIKTMENPI